MNTPKEPAVKDEFNVGDWVEFDGEDSYYEGHIVSVFKKFDESVDVPGFLPYQGPVRLVVQDDRGLLLIKSPKQARKIT